MTLAVGTPCLQSDTPLPAGISRTAAAPLLRILGSMADRDGRVVASVAMLARQLAVTERTAQRGVRALVAAGAVTVEERAGRASRYTVVAR